MHHNMRAIAKLLQGEGPLEATVVTNRWSQLQKVRVDVQSDRVKLSIDIEPTDQDYAVWGVFLHVGGTLLCSVTDETVQVKVTAYVKNTIQLPMVLL